MQGVVVDSAYKAEQVFVKLESIAERIKDATGLGYSPQRNPEAFFRRARTTEVTFPDGIKHRVSIEDGAGGASPDAFVMVLGMESVIRLNSFIEEVRKWVEDPTEDARREAVAEMMEVLDRVPTP